MTKEDEDKRNIIEKVTSFLEQNIIGVNYGLYGLALTGLGIALYRVRPFTKFREASSIPKSFVKRQIKLSGDVIGIEFLGNKPVLMVDHHPSLFPRFRSRGDLLVELEGVNISSNGVCWLQTIVKGSTINFIPLATSDRTVKSIVTQNNSNVANRLVTLGFASVAPFNVDLVKDPVFSKYYEDLLKDENKAERNKMGMWWDQRRFRSFADYMTIKLRALLAKRNIPWLSLGS